MNILFIIPSPMSYHEADDWLWKKSIKRRPPHSISLGILELSAYLRKNVASANIKILDMANELRKTLDSHETDQPRGYEDFLEEKIDDVDFMPDLVGISIMFSSSYKSAMQLSKITKSRWNKAVVVCGGNHATNSYDSLLENPNVDYVIRGEAELSLTELVNNKILGQDNPIQGVLDRKKILEITSKKEPDQSPQLKRRFPVSSWRWELSRLVDNLDELPAPAYDLIDVEHYVRNGYASVMYSRGCVYDCSFCATKTIHGIGIRYKAKAGLYKEVKYLVDEAGFRVLEIQDDMVGVHKKQFFDMIDVLDEFKEKAEFVFSNGLSIQYNDEETLDAFCGIGMNIFKFSVESGSEYTMKHMVKKGAGVDFAKTKRLFNYLRKKNKEVHANFILGFPGETIELMEESIEYIHSCDLDWVYIFSALPLPGTQTLKDFIAMGAIDEKTFDFDHVRHGRRTFDTPEISAVDLENLIYDTNVDYNFFGNKNFRDGFYEKAIDLWNKVILDKYPFHIVGRYCRALAKRELGQVEEAELDFSECVKWVDLNGESKWMYERYKNKMPELEFYLQKIASVDV